MTIRWAGVSIGLLTILALGIAQSRPQIPLPTYYCQKTTTPVRIDGQLSDAAWRTATRARLLNSRNGDPSALPTDVMCTWDDRYLYIAFHSEDHDIWATITEDDAEIWVEEVVEIFLDTNRDGKSYMEFQVSPLNTMVDLFIFNYDERARRSKNIREWDCDGWRYAVNVEGTTDVRTDRDRSWDCEIAIPFSEFLFAPNVPPRPGDAYNINFYRMDRTDEALTVLAWSPTFSHNHTPSRFGTLVFIE